jgi:hypothetical protein
VISRVDTLMKNNLSSVQDDIYSVKPIVVALVLPC